MTLTFATGYQCESAVEPLPPMPRRDIDGLVIESAAEYAFWSAFHFAVGEKPSRTRYLSPESDADCDMWETAQRYRYSSARLAKVGY